MVNGERFVLDPLRGTDVPCDLGPSGLVGRAHDRQTREMTRTMDVQGTLLGPAPPRPARRRQPLKQITVTIGAEAIAAARIGGVTGERVIAEAVRAARPDARNIAVDLGTIRWTDPKTGSRATFATPIVARAALLALARGATPEPFRFILGRGTRAATGGH